MARSKQGKTGPRGSTPAARGRTASSPPRDVTAEPSRAPSADPAPTSARTKQALIIGLLQRPDGATLSDLVAATGWLPHTTRAALTRLRQAGHILEKTRGEAGTVYRIAPSGRTARSRKAA